MFLKITCNYPREEVETLVSFAASHSKADLATVAVNIKNCSGAYAGRAYESIPRIANVAAEAKRLVVLRIGPHYKFPKDNMVTSHKWERRPYSEYKRSKEKHKWRGVSKTKNGKTTNWMEKRIDTRHPYGGKGSPHIVCETWQEQLVCLAAHEFNHIHQYQADLPRGEIECEKAALAALAAYRKGYNS